MLLYRPTLYFFILLVVSWVRYLNGQTNHISFSETCDFISKSPEGFIYLGTTDQAYIFDGHKLVRKILCQEGSPNIQSAFYFDSQHRLWYTSYDALWCFDNKEQKGTRYQIRDPGVNILNSDYYCFGWVVLDSLLWVKQGKQIYQFNLHTKAFIPMAKEVGAKRIMQLERKSFYLSYYYTYSPKIIQFNPTTNKVTRISLWRNWLKKCRAQDVIQYDYDNVLIVSSCGLYLGNVLCEEINEIKWNNASLSQIICAIRLNEYQFLLSTENNGLQIASFNSKNELSAMQSFLDGQFKTVVHRIYQDHSGTLYFSSYNRGLSFLTPSRIIFKTHSNDTFNAAYGLFNSSDLALFTKEGSEKIIYGINIKHGIGAFSTSNYKIDQSYFGESRLFLSNYHSTRRKWHVCNNENTSIELNKLSSLYRVFKTSTSRLIMSGDQGNLYECNQGRLVPIQIYNPNHKIVNYVNEFGNTYFITSLNEDIIQIYNKNNLIKPLREILFSGDVFQQIYDSVHSKLYLATTQGMLILNQPDFESRVISMYDVNKEGECRSLMMDSMGFIWGATKSKIFKFDPQNDFFSTFGSADGIPNGIFLSSGIGQVAPDSLLFIGNKFVLGFNPYLIKQPCIQPSVVLTDFALNYILSKNPDTLNYIQGLKLSYTQNNISFTLKGMNFSDPEDIQLEYYLEPIEPTWKFQAKREAEINYNLLAPGNYILHARSLSTNKQCSSKVIHLPIKILTPYWMQTWFRLLVFFLIIMFGLLILKTYYQRQLEKKDLLLREQRLVIDKQQAIEQERNRIAGEMHDDLGSGLTTIRYLSDRALRQVSSEEEKNQVRKIADQSNQLLRNMSEIIWALNIRNDNLGNLLAYLRRYAHEFLEEQQIPIVWNQQINNTNFKISGEKRRNILLAVKEILHNIAKHARCSQVVVDVHEANKRIQVEIQDNGVGFDFNEAQDRGNGLHNLRKRMSQAEGDIHWQVNQQGTTVTISFPVEL